MNEFIFICYVLAVSSSSLLALRMGKEALIALICVQCVLVNLFVIKEITLFGLTATASDALAVGTSLALNMVQEYHQRALAQKTIWISFLCSLFYVIMTFFHLAYTPASTDTSSYHFQALLSPMPRIVIASLLVYLLVQHADCRLYGYLCTRFKSRHFIIRNYSSVAITQLIDTVLFSFLGLYGINESFSTISTIVEIIIITYSIKLIVISIAAPFLALSKKIAFL
jgi:queuosine precursor transporter